MLFKLPNKVKVDAELQLLKANARLIALETEKITSLAREIRRIVDGSGTEGKVSSAVNGQKSLGLRLGMATDR